MIDEKITDLMRRLDRLEQPDQFALLSRAAEERQDLLGVLLKHLGTSTSPNVQAGAAYLIGCYRLSDGARSLVEKIDLEVSYAPRRGPEPLWERYPVMEALIAIGKPSEPPILELLATDDNPIRRDLGVKVIRHVEGADAAEFILKRAQAAETEAGRKTKLQDALERLAKLPR